MDTPRPVVGPARVSNYFDCFPDEKLIPNVNLDYLRASRAAYNVCVKLTRALNVPWMILVTTMAYWHRFFYVSVEEQEKRARREQRRQHLFLMQQQQQQQQQQKGEGDNNSSRSRSISVANNYNTNSLSNDGNKLIFENDAINREDETEILSEEKTFQKYHPVLVAVSAFFLALKTECVHKSLKEIIMKAFVISSSSSNEYSIRREQIIRLELMLMHSLNFHLFQELPWSRAMELLPQNQNNQDSSNNNNNNFSYGSDTQVNASMLSLFQKVLGYLVQFPFQACLTGNAIAECAVWFVADCVEAPDHYKSHLLNLFNSTNEITRQKFASHILDHIAFFDRPEAKEYPKLGAKITALKTRIRIQYLGGGGAGGGQQGSGSGQVHNNNSSNHNNNGGNQSGNASGFLFGGGGGGSVIGGGGGQYGSKSGSIQPNYNNNNNSNNSGVLNRNTSSLLYTNNNNNTNSNNNTNNVVNSNRVHPFTSSSNSNNLQVSPVPATMNSNGTVGVIPVIRQREEHHQPISVRRMPNHQQ